MLQETEKHKLRYANVHQNPEIREMIGNLVREAVPEGHVYDFSSVDALADISSESSLNIVFLDYATTTADNFAALQQIRSYGSTAPVITIADFVEDVVFVRGIRKGVRGFLYEGALYRDLKPAIAAVRAGEIYISRFT